jgi:hypothetical protein
MTLRFILLYALVAGSLGAQSAEIRKIAGGTKHFLVLFADGKVGGWGDVRDGQLGLRAAISASSGHSTQFVDIALPGRAIDIAAGARTSYFLLEGGNVVALGYGARGELGCGEKCTVPVESPVAVQIANDVIAIEAGGENAFALHRDGTVSGWGPRDRGLLGPTTGIAYSPERIPGVANIKQLSSSATHVLALTQTGEVMTWGKPVFGVIYTDDKIEPPHTVPGLTGAIQVVAGRSSFALLANGSVWVWGNNGHAEFGNGQRTDEDKTRTPRRVPGLPPIARLADGGHAYMLALDRTGAIHGWGNSDWGQVGNGVSGQEQATPARVRLPGVKAVFSGGGNSLALRNDGTLWFWGVGGTYRRVWPSAQHIKLPTQLLIPSGLVQK